MQCILWIKFVTIVTIQRNESHYRWGVLSSKFWTGGRRLSQLVQCLGIFTNACSSPEEIPAWIFMPSLNRYYLPSYSLWKQATKTVRRVKWSSRNLRRRCHLSPVKSEDCVCSMPFGLYVWTLCLTVILFFQNELWVIAILSGGACWWYAFPHKCLSCPQHCSSVTNRIFLWKEKGLLHLNVQIYLEYACPFTPAEVDLVTVNCQRMCVVFYSRNKYKSYNES